MSLRKNKKGASFVSNDRLELIPKAKKSGVKGSKYIEIPRLKSKVPLTPKKLKGYGVATSVTNVVSKIKNLQDSVNKQGTSLKDARDAAKEIKLDIKKIQDRIDKKEQKQPPKTPKTPASTTKNPPRTPKKPPGKTTRGPPKPPKTPGRPPKKPPFPDKNLRNLKKGEKYLYNAIYIEGGKEKQLNLNFLELLS